MAGKKRATVGRGDYKIGYGRPPVNTRFQKGQSGNPGGQPKSPPPPDPGPPLGDPMEDAVLKVMGEVVSHEVRPGKRRRMTRAEALVRELASRADYDVRAFKQITEMHAEAHRMQMALRREMEREEELRRQREIDEELRREEAELRAREDRRQRCAQRRREKVAEEKAAAEAVQLRAALEAMAASEDTVPERDSAPGGEEMAARDDSLSDTGEDDAATGEDARLYEDPWRRRPSGPKPEWSPRTSPAEPAEVATAAVSPGAAAVPAARATSQPTARRDPRAPLVRGQPPQAGHGFGLSGTGPPPPPRFS